MAKTKELKKSPFMGQKKEESSRPFWKEPSRASGSSFFSAMPDSRKLDSHHTTSPGECSGCQPVGWQGTLGLGWRPGQPVRPNREDVWAAQAGRWVVSSTTARGKTTLAVSVHQQVFGSSSAVSAAWPLGASRMRIVYPERAQCIRSCRGEHRASNGILRHTSTALTDLPDTTTRGLIS